MLEIVVAMRGTIYEQGYGLIAQKVMRDTNLSVKSKAIYAYLSSFAGSGLERAAFPGVSLMMKELGIASRGTFYKYRNELIESGYVSVEQQKNEKGRYAKCIYYIESIQKQESQVIDPCTKNQTTVKKTTKKSTTNNISFKSINSKNNIKDFVNKEPQQIIDNLVLEYMNKGLSKKVCFKVVSELPTEGIDNIGAYLRVCLENTLYRHNIKHGVIDPAEKINKKLDHDIPLFNWLDT